jgi:hypothetical protein
MAYVALIYSDESTWDSLSEAERSDIYDRYGAFSDEARAAGVLTGGDELQPTRDATTVRIREGRTLVTDGPYAEVKEALGGYMLLDCDSWDEALDWAAKIPSAEHGAIELRPVYVDEEAGS